jgi:hypothetical protein
MTYYTGFSIIAVLLAVDSGAFAQEGAKQKFEEAQRQNAAQLRRYGWTSRTELLHKGEIKSMRLESVRYDASGQLVKTPMEAPQAPQQDPRGLRGRIVEKKKDEFKELIEGLGALAQSYAHMTPDQMHAFSQSATVSKGQGAMQGTVQLMGTNVVVPGDTITLWIDQSTFLMRQVKVNSIYDKDPVDITVQYQKLVNGPNYPASVNLSYPKKELQVMVTNSNYVLLQGAIPAMPRASSSAMNGVSEAGKEQRNVGVVLSVAHFERHCD